MTLEERIEELKGLNKEPLLEAAIQLATDLYAANASIAEKDVVIDELNAALENLGKRSVNKFKVITVDGKDYGFTAAGYDTLDGKRINTEDLDETSEEVARLIKIGSGLLVELKTEED